MYAPWPIGINKQQQILILQDLRTDRKKWWFNLDLGSNNRKRLTSLLQVNLYHDLVVMSEPVFGRLEQQKKKKKKKKQPFRLKYFVSF